MDIEVIHRCYDDMEAEMIRGLLEEEGIVCMVASSVPHSVMPLTMDGLGEVRISVSSGDAARARLIVEEFTSRTEEDDSDAGDSFDDESDV